MSLTSFFHGGGIGLTRVRQISLQRVPLTLPAHRDRTFSGCVTYDPASRDNTPRSACRLSARNQPTQARSANKPAQQARALATPAAAAAGDARDAGDVAEQHEQRHARAVRHDVHGGAAPRSELR